MHGFGFSFALRERSSSPATISSPSLLAFNVGVEIGQLAVLLVLIPALGLLFRYVLPERLGIIILSALVAHTAWHWMIERGGDLAKFPFPTLDAAFLASVMRGLMAVLILAAGVLAGERASCGAGWARTSRMPEAKRSGEARTADS